MQRTLRWWKGGVGHGEGTRRPRAAGSEPRWLVLWVSFLLVSLAAGVLVQLVILPRLLPQFDAGDGLLVGGDWQAFHARAAEMAAQIKGQGWSTWQLRPDADGLVGITAAVYALTIPKPWTLLPLNAALHATATLALIALLTPLVGSRRRAALAALPFFLFPTTLLWTTQLLKDGYSVPGIMLFLLGWVRLTAIDNWRSVRPRQIAGTLGSLAGGIALIWLVRAYLLQMLLGFSVVATSAVLLVLTWYRLRGKIRWSAVSSAVATLAAVLAMLVVGSNSGGRTVTLDSPSVATDFSWETSRAVPDWLEGYLIALARQRNEWQTRFVDAASNIDQDVSLHSAADMARYAPRALEVALLAPFPAQWGGAGASTVSTIMRRVNALEMIVTYVLLSLLPFAMWQWRRRLDLWVALFFCLGVLLTLGISTLNVGTLHRIRYPFLMVLVSLGLLEGLSLLQWGARLTRLSKRLRHPTRGSGSSAPRALFPNVLT